MNKSDDGWRDRRLVVPHGPGRYLVRLTERGVPHLTEGMRTWDLKKGLRGQWVDENGRPEGVFADDCDWFVMHWRDAPLLPLAPRGSRT